MSSAEHVDLVVVGGGAAGEKGAAQAAYFGKRVAVVERRSEPGGATVHTGTLPSKTLREAALFLSGYRQRDLYGVAVEVTRDLGVARLVHRKDAVRRLETERIRTNLERHGVELVYGVGRLVDATTVEVVDDDGDTRRLTADAILVATGSHPFRPPGIPFDDPDVHDSDSILEIDRLPASLAVLGGGVIGCEYASTFAAMGTQVRLFERRTPLLSFLDAEMVERTVEGMTDLGVRFHLGERVECVTRRHGGLVCALTSGEEFAIEKVLVTSGRVGNTRGLGLEAVGVQIDDRGRVLVDDGFRTAVSSIYADGDVIGSLGLASSSMEQARVAVCRAFGFAYKQAVSNLLPFAVYTIPEVSSVGLSAQEAADRGIDAVVGRAAFHENARGAIIGDREGMMKLVFDRATRRLIGVQCVGERASELVHVGHAVLTLGGTVETFIEMVFNYPTLSETYKYAAYDALAELGPAEGADEPIDSASMTYLNGAGRPEPPLAGDETATLLGSLERQRATLAWKCGRLDAAGLSATAAASSITLGGLLKHLALVEDDYFSRRLLGRDLGPPWDAVDWDADPDWEWHSAAEDTPEQLMALWQEAVARSRAAVTEALADGGLDQLARGVTDSRGESPSLRRILIDLIEEYARHAGHADLIRESVDGLVGEDPPG